jgi:hypothetical protein
LVGLRLALWRQVSQRDTHLQVVYIKPERPAAHRPTVRRSSALRGTQRQITFSKDWLTPAIPTFRSRSSTALRLMQRQRASVRRAVIAGRQKIVPFPVDFQTRDWHGICGWDFQRSLGLTNTALQKWGARRRIY